MRMTRSEDRYVRFPLCSADAALFRAHSLHYTCTGEQSPHLKPLHVAVHKRWPAVVGWPCRCGDKGDASSHGLDPLGQSQQISR